MQIGLIRKIFGSICLGSAIISGIVFSVMYSIFFLSKKGQLTNYQLMMIAS